MTDTFDKALTQGLVARKLPQLDAAFETRLLAKCLTPLAGPAHAVPRPWWLAAGSLAAGVLLGVALTMMGTPAVQSQDVLDNYYYGVGV